MSDEKSWGDWDNGLCCGDCSNVCLPGNSTSPAVARGYCQPVAYCMYGDSVPDFSSCPMSRGTTAAPWYANPYAATTALPDIWGPGWGPGGYAGGPSSTFSPYGPSATSYPGMYPGGGVGKGQMGETGAKSPTHPNPIMGHDDHSYPTRPRTHFIFKDACKHTFNSKFGLGLITWTIKMCGTGRVLMSNDCPGAPYVWGMGLGCVGLFAPVSPICPFLGGMPYYPGMGGGFSTSSPWGMGGGSYGFSSSPWGMGGGSYGSSSSPWGMGGGPAGYGPSWTTSSPWGAPGGILPPPMPTPPQSPAQSTCGGGGFDASYCEFGYQCLKRVAGREGLQSCRQPPPAGNSTHCRRPPPGNSEDADDPHRDYPIDVIHAEYTGDALGGGPFTVRNDGQLVNAAGVSVMPPSGDAEYGKLAICHDNWSDFGNFLFGRCRPFQPAPQMGEYDDAQVIR